MPQSTNRIDPGRAALWASAFVIAALVVLQIGSLPGNPAFGDTVSNRDAYSVLTVDSGRGGDTDPDEMLVVIDNRAEIIMLFEVDGRSGAISPRDGGSLPFLFRNALNR